MKLIPECASGKWQWMTLIWYNLHSDNWCVWHQFDINVHSENLCAWQRKFAHLNLISMCTVTIDVYDSENLHINAVWMMERGVTNAVW